MANDPGPHEPHEHPPRPEIPHTEPSEPSPLPPLDDPVGAGGDETPPPLQPPPKGLIIGGGAIIVLLVVSAVMLLGGGDETDPAVYEVDGAGALAGDVEADGSAPPADTSSSAIGADAPGTLPVADPAGLPDADRVDDLERRLETLEDRWAQIEGRLSVLIESFDQLLDEAPWEALEGNSAPLADEELASLVEQVEALQKGQDTLKALERRVAGLESAHRAAIRARASRPPFTLVAIDYWDNRPYATLESQGRHARLSEGDRLSGWQLHRLDAAHREARFIRPDGRMVRLTVED